MSIASKLNLLQQDITNARNTITDKGGTVTVDGGSSQLSNDIDTIPSGSAPIPAFGGLKYIIPAKLTIPQGTDQYNYGSFTYNVCVPTKSESIEFVAIKKNRNESTAWRCAYEFSLKASFSPSYSNAQGVDRFTGRSDIYCQGSGNGNLYTYSSVVIQAHNIGAFYNNQTVPASSDGSQGHEYDVDGEYEGYLLVFDSSFTGNPTIAGETEANNYLTSSAIDYNV